MDYRLYKSMTVDPGWTTGIAVWTGDLDPMTLIIREPEKHKKNKIEPDRLAYMFRRFESLLKNFTYEGNLNQCYIEGVELWAYSPRSMTAAKRGDLFALAYMVGGYTAICQRNGVDVHYVYPTGGKEKGHIAWKGQLDSTQIAMRIQRINGKAYPEHVREAVGMGLSVIGIL